MVQPITADDIRAECARRRLPFYILAARIGLHPVRLSRFLNGHQSMTPELTARIQRALAGDTVEQRSAGTR
jgi:plasmid maintenance system antidote protein VapI